MRLGINFEDLQYEEDGRMSYQDELYSGLVYSTTSSREIVGEMVYLRGEEIYYRTLYEEGKVKEEMISDTYSRFTTEWYENGHPKQQKITEQGVATRRKQWNENGELTEDFTVSESDYDYKIVMIRRERELKRTGGETIFFNVMNKRIFDANGLQVNASV